jgi:murein DD-endopeptidase MepM/ murein hydrolase activator NlpD
MRTFYSIFLVLLFLSLASLESYAQNNATKIGQPPPKIGQTIQRNVQNFPKIIKKSNKQIPADQNTPERKILELGSFDQISYLKTLSSTTDSIIFENNVDLLRTKSIVTEENNPLIWVPTNELINVTEQIQIDNIWITAYEHFSAWDSEKINIYDFDPKKFTDTIPIRLYDQRIGYDWKLPLDSTPVTSPFGPRWRSWHYGVDLDLETGDPVYSGFDGIVRIAGYDRYGYGHYVVVRHKNGLETLYGHMSKILAEVGQELKAGDLIGKGGSTGRSTGSHLHYELRFQGAPFNPERVYDFKEPTIRDQIYLITADTFSHVASTAKNSQSSAYHKVRRGENLGSIAKKYGVSVSQLTKLNKISTRTILRIGQNLRVK